MTHSFCCISDTNQRRQRKTGLSQFAEQKQKEYVIMSVGMYKLLNTGKFRYCDK